MSEYLLKHACHAIIMDINSISLCVGKNDDTMNSFIYLH